MGTRARINVLDGNQIILSIFNHWDGYPTGLGAKIKEAFGECAIINGIGMDQEAPAFANGMGCFAAQLVAMLKTKIGDVSIRNISINSYGEEYVYTLSEVEGQLHMAVASGSMTMLGAPGDEESEMRVIYSGPLSDFEPSDDSE